MNKIVRSPHLTSYKKWFTYLLNAVVSLIFLRCPLGTESAGVKGGVLELPTIHCPLDSVYGTCDISSPTFNIIFSFDGRLFLSYSWLPMSVLLPSIEMSSRKGSGKALDWNRLSKSLSGILWLEGVKLCWFVNTDVAGKFWADVKVEKFDWGWPDFGEKDLLLLSFEKTGLWEDLSAVGLEFNVRGRLLKLSGAEEAAFGLWRGITLVPSATGATATLFVTFIWVFLDSDSNCGTERSSNTGVCDFYATTT